MAQPFKSLKSLGKSMVADVLADEELPGVEEIGDNEALEPPVSEPTAVPTPDATAARMAQLEAQIAQLLAAQANPQKQVIEVKTDVRFPQNPAYNEKSVFTNPEGERENPKAHLKRETYFLSMRQREDALTPYEIELFNRFEDGVTEAKDGRWKAEAMLDGTRKVLRITAVEANTIDGRAGLPSLVEMLEILLDGGRHRKIGSDRDDELMTMVQALRAEITALRGGARA